MLLRNPTDEHVIPIVEELCRRLPPNYGRRHNNASALADADNSLERSDKMATPSWDAQNENQDGSLDGEFTDWECMVVFKSPRMGTTALVDLLLVILSSFMLHKVALKLTHRHCLASKQSHHLSSELWKLLSKPFAVI